MRAGQALYEAFLWDKGFSHGGLSRDWKRNGGRRSESCVCADERAEAAGARGNRADSRGDAGWGYFCGFCAASECRESEREFGCGGARGDGRGCECGKCKLSIRGNFSGKPRNESGHTCPHDRVWLSRIDAGHSATVGGAAGKHEKEGGVDFFDWRVAAPGRRVSDSLRGIGLQPGCRM